jgi:hypothetical protein
VLKIGDKKKAGSRNQSNASGKTIHIIEEIKSIGDPYNPYHGYEQIQRFGITPFKAKAKEYQDSGDNDLAYQFVLGQ